MKAGAFDGMAERAALLASLDRMIGHGQRVQKQRESGQASLFDLMGASEQPAVAGPGLQNVREAPQQQKLAWEKELLGVYLSEHPFARAAERYINVSPDCIGLAPVPLDDLLHNV